jgi:hypothetical protein
VTRLGSDAACVLCGYQNPFALIAVPRTLLEAHHIFGRKRDPKSTVKLCRNCHAEITEELRRAGVPMVREHDPRKRAAYALLGGGVFFRKYADSIEKLARELLEERR